MSSFRFLSSIFPPPPSLLADAMSVVSVVSLTCIGVSEAVGSHLQYSKFWDAAASPSRLLLGHLGGDHRVSSRAGMVLLYAPALLAALAALGIPGVVEAPRGVLVASALAIHFLKRVLEVAHVFLVYDWRPHLLECVAAMLLLGTMENQLPSRDQMATPWPKRAFAGFSIHMAPL